jgi:alkylation response protein AidB-like acyl-CoA dehydrogenase
VDLALADEQQAFAEHLRSFMEKECPPSRVRAAEPLGFDAELWREVVAMGLPAIAVPAELGGGGASLEELGLAALEVGRHVAPVPLIEASAATNLLARCGATDLLGDVIEGAIATITLLPADDGTARLVPAGAVAEIVLTLRGDDLLALRDGRSQRPSPSNLGTAPIADWDLDTCDTTVLASGGVAVTHFTRAVDEWRALQAMAQIGIAQRALDLGVDYVKQRRAFGVLVGWFQSVQHRLAEVVTRIEGAQLLVHEALWALDSDEPDASALASMAFLFASETAYQACSESLQFHGGYGFTLEYDIQLYLRRAKAWSLALGDPHAEHRRVASLLLGVEA